MNRTLRLVGMAAMVLLLAASCKKEGKENGGKQMMTFSAGIEQNDGAKTGLTPQGYPNPQEGQTARYWKQFWVAGDKINVNGEPFTLESGAGEQSATFTGLAKPGKNYYAIYPVSDDAEFDDDSYTTATFTLPETQYLKYVVNGTDTIYTADFAPMAATCSKDADVLQFENLCTLLELRVYTKSDFDCHVNHVQLIANDEGIKLWGTYTYNFEGDSKLTYSSGGTNQLDLNCVMDGQKLLLSKDPKHPTSLLFVLPAGLEFTSGFMFNVYNEDEILSGLHVNVPEFATYSSGLVTVAGKVVFNTTPALVEPDFEIGINGNKIHNEENSVDFSILSTQVNNNYINLEKAGVLLYPTTVPCPETYDGSDYFCTCDGTQAQIAAAGGYAFTVSGIEKGNYYARAFAVYSFKDDRGTRTFISKKSTTIDITHDLPHGRK